MESVHDALLDDVPGLEDDAEFWGMFNHYADDLFPQDRDDYDYDAAERAFNELEAYLDEYYDIDFEYYWDWEAWRDSYDAA